MIRVVGSSMEQVDVSMEEAAWTLGCTKKRAFATVLLPNITSGIFAAFMLAFVNSFNNVPVSMFLSGPGVTMASNDFIKLHGIQLRSICFGIIGDSNVCNDGDYDCD